MVQKFMVENSGEEKFMVKRCGDERFVVEMTGVEMSFNLFQAIEKVIYYSETYEPELVRSCISNYFLAQKTSEYVKVVLTGEGTN